MAVLTISLSEDRQAFIDSEIAAGRFASPSEFVSALILAEQLRKNHDQVESLLMEAEDETVEPIAGGTEFWANMHKELDEFIRTEGLK